MFKETLLLTPKMSASDLAKMESTLSQRFGRVAKKFGKGLLGALSGGGIAGIALGLIDKLLNPLKETQEAIDRSLKRADDIVTNAKQYNTTPGKLARLQAFGSATGLDAGNLDILITKFQNAVAEAEADPTKDTSVRKFARKALPGAPGEAPKYANQFDAVDSFFRFIQGLQKLDTNQQLLVQSEVFGEKQILKMADFLQSDFAGLSKRIGGPSEENLNKALNKGAGLNDLKDELASTQELKDMVTKGRVINEGMVRTQAAMRDIEIERENKRIASYQDLAKISMTAEKISGFVEQGLTGVATLIDKVTNLSTTIKNLTEGSTFKNILKFIGGGK